jgi:hypothetical protein
MLQQINNMDMIPGEFYYKKYLFNNNFGWECALVAFVIGF